VVLDEAGGALGVEEQGEGEVAEDSAAAMGSTVRPVCEGKDSPVRGRPGVRAGGLRGGFGKGEGFGGEGFEDGGEGLFLVGGGDDLGIGLAVAAEVCNGSPRPPISLLAASVW